MLEKICCLTIASCVSLGVVLAQEPSQPPTGDREVDQLLHSGVPESTIVSEIQVLAETGSTFDISPAALARLRQDGASETILNTIIWAQMTVVPGRGAPVPRGVFYRSGQNATALNSFLVWGEFQPRWSAWPFYGTGPHDVALNASPSIVQIAEASPMLYVQGFASDAQWQLVKIAARGSDYREMHLKRKHAFNKDFFSDAVFDRDDLRPLTVAPAGDTYTLRPSAPLDAGDYAVCAQQPGGGWMRACYEFQVTGM